MTKPQKTLHSKLLERSLYYHQRFLESHDEYTKQLVNCILASHLHGVSVGLKLAAEMDAEENKK